MECILSVYTDIVISCDLKPDTSEAAIEEFRYWLGLADPNTRDQSKLYYGTFDEYSHSHPGALQRALEADAHGYTLSLRAKIKNYDRQIEKFLAVVALHSVNTGFVGYMRHEIDEDPTLIYFQDNGVSYRKIKQYAEVPLP